MRKYMDIIMEAGRTPLDALPIVKFRTHMEPRYDCPALSFKGFDISSADMQTLAAVANHALNTQQPSGRRREVSFTHDDYSFTARRMGGGSREYMMVNLVAAHRPAR